MSTQDLSGKIALVTGASRGIGAAIADTLAQAGATVIGTATSESGAAAIGERLAQWGGQGRALNAEEEGSIENLISAIEKEFGKLDILVNNAGGSPHAAAATASARFFDAILKLNLHAAMYMSQAAFAPMKAGGGGSIVNISSVSGIRPSPMTAAYGAAKAGLLSLTQSLAQEWGPDGVRVNAIIAGLMQTENAEETYGDAAAQAAVAKSLPLQRMGTGMDVAGAVLWLSSRLASWVSGARINVDGGGERPYFLDLVKGN